MKIGVYGSALVEHPSQREAAVRLGKALAAAGCTLVTGACSGLPYLTAKTAAEAGAPVIGYSPVRSLDEQHAFTPDDDLSIYNELIFVPETFPMGDRLEVAKKYRNVISTASCDAGIITAGRWGTLHEFCSLVDYGKTIGVLTDTGGIADQLPALFRSIRKSSGSTVFFDNEPEMLVEAVTDFVKTALM